MASRAAHVDPHRIPALEYKLTELYGVKWEFFSSVPINQFDIDGSLHNQVRIVALDGPTCTTYQENLERGDVFPAVVGYRPGRGANRKVRIIDGNHRLEVHKNLGVPLALYEIAADTAMETIVRLTYALNTEHGRHTTPEERLLGAYYLVDNGSSHQEAARTVGLSASYLEAALTKRRAETRAKTAGVDLRAWDKLNEGVRTTLNKIRTDEGLRAAVDLAAKATLTKSQADHVAKALNATSDGTKQVRAVTKMKNDMFTDQIQQSAGGVLSTGRRPGGMNPKSQLGLALSSIDTLMASPDTIVRLYAAGERAQRAQEVREAAADLAKLADLIEAGQG